jgi:two-component system chemotaxis response regulator CheY
MRVLVVDDSSTMRSVLKLYLRGAGFEVLDAKDGRDALSVLESSESVDLALIDWNMPVMGGFELLTAIRQDRKFDGMKVVMVTTESGVQEMIAALDAGAAEYIMKPFTRDVVLDKLHMIGL